MEKYFATYAASDDLQYLPSTEHGTKLPTWRSNFERDRDRILHSKAFKRLSQKTQVFIYPGGDHHRNRLTHTLEVESIADSISTALRLNTFLCSAIALSHDLGATPFGRSGEEALNDLMKKNSLNCFKHNHQGVRVVESLEQQYPDYMGLNLTLAVKEGILKHKDVDKGALSLHSEHLTQFVKDTELNVPSTLEGQAVKISDDIAQIYHYIEDGLRYDLIPIDKVWSTQLWQKAVESIRENYGLDFQEFTSSTTTDIVKLSTCRFLIKFMVTTLVENSKEKINEIGENNIQSGKISDQILSFDRDTSALISSFHYEIILPFIFDFNKVVIMNSKAYKTIECIFEAFREKPQQLPLSTYNLYQTAEKKEGNVELRVLADHIAGMTDRYAIKIYKDLCDIEYSNLFF